MRSTATVKTPPTENSSPAAHDQDQQQEVAGKAMTGKAMPGKSTPGPGPGRDHPAGFHFDGIPLHQKSLPLIQTKLEVNSPGDEYEEEADEMADEVMERSSSTESTSQETPDLSRVGQGSADASAAANHPSGPTMPESPAVNPPFDKDKKREDDEEEPAIKKIQRKTSVGGGIGNGSNNGDTNAVKRTLQSEGRPMERPVRSFMESRFGFDFSRVQIHDDPLAHRSAKDLQALAYTHKQHIVFGPGQYQPGTQDGKKLLAHELAHVVQQTGDQRIFRKTGTPAPDTAPGITEPRFILEDGIVPEEGQLNKSEFLHILNLQVCKTVDEGLMGTPFTSDNCPYIIAIFSRHKDSTPLEIEQLIERYAGVTSKAENATDLIQLMQGRVMEAVEYWKRTGRIAGVPETMQTTGNDDMTSPATETTGSSRPMTPEMGEKIERQVFFKANEGGARSGDSPHNIINRLGKGSQMEGGTKSQMETAFGTRFPDVRIHTDNIASGLSSSMNARAFTIGNHIAFASGEHRPGTPVGDALIAHELAHVVQQQTAVSGKTATGSSTIGDLEDDADNAATGAVLSTWGKGKKWFGNLKKKALPRLKSGLRLQRCDILDYQGPPAGLAAGPVVTKIPEAYDLHIESRPKRPAVITGMSLRLGFSSNEPVSVNLPGSSSNSLYTTNGPWTIIDPENNTGEQEPDKGVLVYKPEKTGTYTFHAPVITDKGKPYTLEYVQKVISPEELATTEISKLDEVDFTTFRIRLQLELMKRQHFNEIALVNSNSTEPFISCSQPNPEGANSDPDRIYHQFIVHPSPKGKMFKWYVRAEDWTNTPGKMSYRKALAGEASFKDYPDASPDIEFEKKLIDGKNAWVNPAYLQTNMQGFKFIMTNRGTYTITCEELDEKGVATGGVARYVQSVISDDDFKQLKGLEKHATLVDENFSKLVKGTAINLKAVYVNQETGNTMPLSLYLGKSAKNPKEYMLLDVTPGMSRIEYDGTTVKDVMDTFNRGNSYPKGKLLMRVPPNTEYANTMDWTFTTTGASLWSVFSSTAGWFSLGLAAAGLVASFVPGGQPVAAALFIGAAATGATSAGFSLYDRLQQTTRSATGIALDIVTLAGSILGGVQAFRALKYGAVVAGATTAGRVLLWTGFTTDTVAGVLFTESAVEQIKQILDSNMSSGEQTGAIVKLLALLVLQHGLWVLSAKDMGGAKTRINQHLGANAQGLSNEMLHLLNYLDDTALKTIGRMAKPEVEGVIALIKRNPEGVAKLMATDSYAGAAELEKALTQFENRITAARAGLFPSVDLDNLPPGWTQKTRETKTAEGYIELETRVEYTDPVTNEVSKGYFIRQYDPASKKLIMSHAFLRSGSVKELPSVMDNAVAMLPGRGTPTAAFFTMAQMKKMGIGYAALSSVKMSTVQNIETLLHLAWLRGQHPNISDEMLIEYTASVKYAETAVVQSGSQIIAGSYKVSGGTEETIATLKSSMNSPADLLLIETLQKKYQLSDSSKVRWSMNIEFGVTPATH